MNSLREISTADFESALSTGNVSQMAILQAALGMGVTLFGLVIVVLYLTQAATPDEGAVEVLQVLSLAHLALLVGAIVGGRFLFDAQFSDRNLERAAPGKASGSEVAQNPATRALMHMRTAIILRLGLLEAPALFGLVVCFLTVINGLAPSHPIFLLNGLSAIGFVGFVVQTLPTRDRLLQMFVERIRKGLIG